MQVAVDKNGTMLNIYVQIKEKLGDEIQTANAEFSELQSKMITEKENKKLENEMSKEKDHSKVSFY